jgi:stage II sporulation protein D
MFFLVAYPLFAQTEPHTVRIGVLGIFHPQELALRADPGSQLLVVAGGQQLFLQSQSTCDSITIRRSETMLLIQGCGKRIRTERLRATDRDQKAADFVIAVPGKLARRYEGVLEIKTVGEELVPVVCMDLELAVASAVQAETNHGTPAEALKAQAVVSRSYLSANFGRHKNFDFCDLTHCQALREPPGANSPAWQAAAATQGLVLTYEGKPIASMFTRSCGGRTRTPQELGLAQAEYPYFSVACEVCGKDPVRWTRRLTGEDASILSAKGENGRLAICRRLGWSAVPSNNFVAREENGEVILAGTGQGHGIGLCQRGAAFLAGQSSDFREILIHYFPKTKIEPLDSGTAALH